MYVLVVILSTQCVCMCFQITETYAFLPREAVTRFLLGCTECQRRPRSPSPASVLPTPSPSPTLPLPPAAAPRALTDISPVAPPLPAAEAQGVAPTQPSLDYYGLPPISKNATASVDKDLLIHGSKVDAQNCEDISQSQTKIDGPLRTSTPEPKRSSNPLDVCNLTSRNPPPPSAKITTTPPKKRHLNHLSAESKATNEQRAPAPKLWSPVERIKNRDDQSRPRTGFPDGEIDYSLPITTTYLKYMRSLGCTDEDALKFEKTVCDSYPLLDLSNLYARYVRGGQLM